MPNKYIVFFDIVNFFNGLYNQKYKKKLINKLKSSYLCAFFTTSKIPYINRINTCIQINEFIFSNLELFYKIELIYFSS